MAETSKTLEPKTGAGRRFSMRDINGLAAVLIALSATLVSAGVKEADFRAKDQAAAAAAQHQMIKKADVGAHCPILDGQAITPSS